MVTPNRCVAIVIGVIVRQCHDCEVGQHRNVWLDVERGMEDENL
jgi:hypothetical protein